MAAAAALFAATGKILAATRSQKALQSSSVPLLLSAGRLLNRPRLAPRQVVNGRRPFEEKVGKAGGRALLARPSPLSPRGRGKEMNLALFP